MSITLELIEQNYTAILDKTGYQSYVPWQEFTKTSSAVVKSIDSLTKWLGIFRQMQHKNFIQTMKRLKSLDIPDSIQSVRKKKLPKEVLKPIIPRFKLLDGKVQLIDTKQNLKQQALKQYNQYKVQNEQLVAQFDKYIQFLTAKAIQAGFKQSQVTVADLQPFKSTMQFKFDQQKIKKISDNIKTNYLPGTKFIDANTYSQIVDKSYQCVSQTYVTLVKSSRKQQRQNINNHKVYFDLINAFLNNSESLVIEAQRKIYQGLGLDPAKWEQNQQALIQKGFGQMLMMCQTGFRQRVRKAIPSTKDVSMEQAVQVIKYQIRVVKQRGAQIKSILSQMPKGIESAQIVPVLLSLILNDYVYDAFGYEEQDFMKNMNGMILFTNPELAQVFGQMEHEIMKLMQQLGIIPEDISNLMMGPQGQQMAQMMAAQMGGMGLDPSMLQQGGNGQNPLEMLQAQQMAQFQQMMFQQKQDKKQPPQ